MSESRSGARWRVPSNGYHNQNRDDRRAFEAQEGRREGLQQQGVSLYGGSPIRQMTHVPAALLFSAQ